MKFDITFSKVGTARIEADSLEAAYKAAKNLSETDVIWTESLDVTDVQESDEE